MPIRPTSRLDLHLVPPGVGPDAVDAVRATWEAWVADGFLEPTGAPGPRASVLVPGGFVRARVDDPGRPTLYANQIGGFQVRCPSCGAGLARELRPFEATSCPSCGGRWAFAELDCRPPAAVGWASLVLADVATATSTSIPAGWRLVLRRPA